MFDAVIAGAGAAGMMAALRAAGGGARVALLAGPGPEQSNLWTSGGLFSAAGTRWQLTAGIDDSPARWTDDIDRKTAGAVDPLLVEAVTARSADAAHFFGDTVEIDISLSPGPLLPGHSAARLHSGPMQSGAELGAAMLAAVRRNPRISLLSDLARGLLVDRSGVQGLRTERGEVRANWTLLATGGFAANAAMVQAHMPEIVGAVYIGCGPNDGWAVREGTALGGEALLMDGYQGQGHTMPDGRARLGPGLTPDGAIVVNNLGRRFANEDLGPSEFGAYVLSQPGGTAVELFDRRIHERALRMNSYRIAVANGSVLEAESVESLASTFGLPPAVLAETLATYGASVDGALDPFGRRHGMRHLHPPFMAARVTGALAHTQGGLRVDRAARVLRRDGSPIPGLLAAGGAACGISGHGAAGYLPGNGLGQAFALGYVAAETVLTTR